jgi:SAM-dependent methyltransferase
MQSFGWSLDKIDRRLLDSRLLTVTATAGWSRTVAHLLALGVPLADVAVAEVGCGTGTYALSLALLGARATLIDADDHALAVAQKSFALYGVNATFVKADVVDPVEPELAGRFHLVASGGLVEHFRGSARSRCFEFHRLLLRQPGVARVGVPNGLSPFYQMVRGFRRLTRTWGLEVEIPYTPSELKRLARDAGFKRSEVFGNNPLGRDARDYSAGLVSACLDVWPRLGRSVRRLKKGSEPSGESPVTGTVDVVPTVTKRFDAARRGMNVPHRRSLKDSLSAGLILHGFTSA